MGKLAGKIVENSAGDLELNEQGLKFDDGKLPIHLIPPEAIDAMAERLRFGAKKYGEHNWSKGIKFSKLFSATMRHAWAHWRGEDIDKDSGLCNLSGVLINVAFMIAFTRRGRKDLDDRPSSQNQAVPVVWKSKDTA